jgi:hypothetical protein
MPQQSPVCQNTIKFKVLYVIVDRTSLLTKLLLKIKV